MEGKPALRQYRFLAVMLAAMVAGCVVGGLLPGVAQTIRPLGTVFINMMFCVVVPLVFFSISASVAGMNSRRRAGRIMGVTLTVFVVTGAIAAALMFVLMKLFPPVTAPWSSLTTGEVGEYASLGDLLVNFFTASDFVGLLSRQAMLPLIVFSILFGFSVNLSGGPDGRMAQLLREGSAVMLRFVQLVTCYAPVAFFAIFSGLVADYGGVITAGYGRAMAVYYPLCLLYLVTVFPLLARFGGGRQGPGIMLRHILRPALVSLGTCSSVATIPTNMEAAEATGIRKDVAELVIPMGATMHMDGSCFSCVLKIAFVLGVFGRSMEWRQLPLIVLVAVLSSVGMSGVPGGGYIGEYIICSLFFPGQMELAFPILVAIGNLVDPPATMINATGDYAACFVVSRYTDGPGWLAKATPVR